MMSIRASREWGMIYLTENGLAWVTNNLDETPSNWFARFYYKDERGNIYLKEGEGRKICFDLNCNTNRFYANKFASAIRLELKEMDIQKALSDLEKITSNNSNKGA